MGLNQDNSILSNAIKVSSTYNVGIGTSSPNSILEIKGSTTTNSIRLGSPTGSGTYNLISLNGNSAEGQYIGLAGGGGTDTNLYIQSGNAGSLIFRTGNGTAFTERMRIANTYSSLLINGTTNTYGSDNRGVVHINGESGIYGITISGSNAGYMFHSGSALSFNQVKADCPINMFNEANSHIAFGSNNIERMRIRANGNITIGAVSGNSGVFDIRPGVATSDGATLSASYTGSGSYGPFIFHTSDVERIRISSGGELSINTTITTGRLSLYENGTKWAQWTRHDRTGFQFFSVFLHNTTEIGSITGNNTNTTFATSSDYRLKEDLKDFNGIDLVSKLNVYDFAWKSDNTRRMYGVVAHEIAEILPYAVTKQKNLVKEDGTIDPQGVDYSLITPILVKAIQELKAEIDILKQQ
jgi:hypothetical protein